MTAEPLKTMSDPEFDLNEFKQNLENLKNSQTSIQSLSTWCIQRRVHHKKIVNTWLAVLKQVKIEQRLTLFNLANDVIQNSKRKNYEFVASWGTALQRATTMVRDDPKVKQKIARIFKIWEERNIYNEEFLTDLNGLLNTVTAAKRLSGETSGGTVKTPATGEPATGSTDPDDFQATQLIGYINNSTRLQEKTEKAFKQLSKAPEVDIETIRQSGKDREHVENLQSEVNESLDRCKDYIHALKSEIKVRNILIAALGQADEFYRSQRGDVKTVAIAYRNFGLRIKTMKKKLDELTTTLPSPIPSPDINAPSPPPDADLELPDEDSFSSFALNGSASFLGSGQLPFDISDFDNEGPRNPIQVINSRSEEEEKGHNLSLSQSRPPQPVPPVAKQNEMSFGIHQGNNNYNPGSSNYDSSFSTATTSQVQHSIVPPPMHEAEEYTPSSSWNLDTSSWISSANNESNNGQSIPGLSNKAPTSPPFFERKGTAPVAQYNEQLPGPSSANDIDQRHLNPLLGKIESLVDVDHRNLISLTGSPGGQQSFAGPLNTSVPPPLGGPPGPVQKPALLPTPQSLPPPPWQQQQPPLLGNNVGGGGGGDSDFRGNYMQSPGIPPPPMPPPFYGGVGNNSFGNFQMPMGMFNPLIKKSPQVKNGDNMDSVDMEMSDDEQDCGNGRGSNMDGPGLGGPPFMNFPPPQQQPPWGGDGAMSDSQSNGGNNGPWNKPPMDHGGAGPGGGFFPPGGGAGGGPMFRPGVPNNFRGRGGAFGRGGMGPPGGNLMFRGRGSPFGGRGGANNRGRGRGVW